LVGEHIVQHQLEYETKLEMESKKTFDEYAKEWWNDFKQIRESHKKRPVPIFLETEDRDQLYFLIP
jgi:centrosomal protein CEP76